LEERERLLGHQIQTKKQFRLIPGAFIISRVQCWHQAYAIVPDEIPPNMIASINYDQFAISPKVDRRFFWWLSHSPYFTETVRSSAFGVVIEKMVFDRAAWLEKKIPLPLLEEQQRIVARIEELASRIEEARGLRRQAGEDVEALVRSSIDERFTNLGSGARDSSFGDEDVIQIIDGDRGKNYPQKIDFSDHGYCLFLNTGNERKGYFEFSRCDFITREKDAELRKGKLQRGDVVLTTRGTLGNFAYYDQAVPYDNVRINSGMVILRPNSSVLSAQYLTVILNSPQFVDHVGAQLSGSAQSQLPINKLSRIPFALPSRTTQEEMVAYLDDLRTKTGDLEALQAETTVELDALMPSILDTAFRGEL
jgi:type I restriction enzyme, S subunit